MYINNDLIETVMLDPELVSKPGYLGKFKRSLKLKYQEEIQISGTPADFLVVIPASSPDVHYPEPLLKTASGRS